MSVLLGVAACFPVRVQAHDAWSLLPLQVSAILADRLQRLEACGIISISQEATDRRKVIYRLTEKGIDLVPVLVELMLWGTRHEDTAAPAALLRKMKKQREEFISEVRRRWAEGDPSSNVPNGSSR